MAITVNGESRQYPAAPTIAQLVESLDLVGKRIAIERNGEIVPRSRYPEVTVSDGDALEVVVAVGGG
ncbi:MAG: sulfur carrier protein ThiS [Burkholderiales bacterium]|nr:sulfur carrier protein ThiS [Burkholderiales bacterium]